ncbi:MAG: N-acetylglucosamine-6-phosphate deacetylase [Pyrinomonadaceae bacterium]|nr:N-acetylglucosamine-6-phosphate deacetylase [Pyrinomonadaceae bacterium]
MLNPATESLLIEGASVVTPSGTKQGLSLFIEGGRIKRIFSSKESAPPNAGKVFALDGLTLFPGFIDIHMHGAVGIDVMEASAEYLHRIGRYLSANGVTAWLPTIVPAPDKDYRSVAQSVEQLISKHNERAPVARALGLHYEGPFVNDEQCGALRSVFFRTFNNASDLRKLAVLKAEGARHMMTLAPEIDGGLELVQELKRRGWIASIGHTRAPVEILERAFKAGARHMTHFFNGMPALHHRAPGPVGWGLAHEEVTCDVIADAVHVDPLALRLLLRAKGAERVSLISDSVAPTGQGDGQFQFWNETITVKDGRTQNKSGHIAGSVINLSDAVRTMRGLGVSANDIALMASRNPARLLVLEDDCGTIEEGKRADLVALSKDYSVRMTIIGGRIAFEQMSQ